MRFKRKREEDQGLLFGVSICYATNYQNEFLKNCSEQMYKRHDMKERKFFAGAEMGGD